MSPPILEQLASGHVDDLRCAADRHHQRSRIRAHRHPGTTIARVIGVSLIRIGVRLAGPESRTEPRFPSAREAMS